MSGRMNWEKAAVKRKWHLYEKDVIERKQTEKQKQWQVRQERAEFKRCKKLSGKCRVWTPDEIVEHYGK